MTDSESANELIELSQLLDEDEEMRPSFLRSVDDEETPSDAFSEGKESTDRGRRGSVVQWSTGDDITYVPTGEVVDFLPPGAYSIGVSNRLGLFFSRIPVKTEGLLKLPSANIDKVTAEIAKFWDREDMFRKFGLAHKRGILLWGPPGCGKTSLLQLLMKDVISRGGIVLDIGRPSIYIEGYRILRQIQPDTPVITILEDIDSILENYRESEVLNVLDGIEAVHRTVFIATTNYPEKLGKRIVNRPSRFDKRFKIALPNAESRMAYLKFLLRDEAKNHDLEQWVRDTEKFTLAHLKELFVAVVILGDNYKNAVRVLKTMNEKKIGSFMDDDETEDEDTQKDPGQYL